MALGTSQIRQHSLPPPQPGEPRAPAGWEEGLIITSPSTFSHPWTLSPRLRGGGGSWPDGDRLCPTTRQAFQGQVSFRWSQHTFGAPLSTSSASPCLLSDSAHVSSLLGLWQVDCRFWDDRVFVCNRTERDFLPQSLPKVLAEWPKGGRASGHN